MRCVAGRIGIAFLTALILFLSTGIHQLEGHLPVLAPVGIGGHISIGPILVTEMPGNDHCNACLFSQLLGQCIFPVLENPVAAQSRQERVLLFKQTTSSPVLGRQVDRGPPSGLLS
jgi:hypothetical protein